MRKNYFLAILVCLLASSCVNEDDFDFDRFAGGSISPVLSAPFGHTCISLDSLISHLNKENSNIHVNTENNGQYVFEYKNDRLKYNEELPVLDSIANALFTLPPIFIPIGTISGVGTVPFPIDGSFLESMTQLSPIEDSIVLTEATFLHGSLSVSVASDLNRPTFLVIKSEDMISVATGEVFLDTVPVGNNNDPLVVDLSQYKVSFQSNGTNSHNNISFGYKLLIDVGTDGSNISSSATDIHLQFANLKLAYAKGKTGKKRVDIADSVAFNIFEGRESGLSGILDIAGATLSLEGESNLGFPLTFTISELSVANKYDESRSISLSDNKIHLPAAPSVGRIASVNKEIQLNTRNIFSIFPNSLRVRATLVINPDEISGFIATNSDVSLKARLKIPMKGSLEGVIYETTINIAELSISDVMKELSLISQAKNSFPFAVEVQAYCLSNDIVIDSLFETGKFFSVKPGVVNSDGKVVAPSQTRSVVDINGQRINSLRESDRLKLAIHLDTPAHEGGKMVMLTRGSVLDLKFGVKVKTQINF